ncbi:hypothetical protein AYJ00_07215 [Shewanella algae]|uniref:lipopolysaccharide biosynthesis protein n=1 Tax=Shewanella algae TaxID=38313 RepID=UPI001183E3D6|nr:oligosaccharide flippase family protein [Shewanella algae]TVL51518.1 hypothetical protein AYJ00_07215 [Shewanella algae]
MTLMSRSIAVKNIAVRVALILLKFAFLVLLSRDSSVDNVGQYALILSTVTILVFVLGGEFHSIACRAVVTEKRLEERYFIFTNHMLFLLVSFLFFLLVYFLLGVERLVGSYFFLGGGVLLILFFELISQDLGRYLLMVEKPLQSNVLQLVRGGLWLVPAYLLILKNPVDEHIHIIINSWIIGGVASVLIGFFLLRNDLKLRFYYNKVWIWETLKLARGFWLIAMITQLQTYSDRYVLQYFYSEVEVGVLALFQSFTNIIQTFVQVGVITIFLPRLIKVFSDNNTVEFKNLIGSMYKNTLFIIVFMAISLLFFINPVLILIGKQAFIESKDVFYIQLLSTIAFTLATVPHMILYSMKRDMLLLFVSLTALPVFYLLLIFSAKFYGLAGVVYSMLVFNTLVFGSKFVLSKYFVGKWAREET